MLIVDAVRARLLGAGARRGQKLLVAFSGGCDSTGLLAVLREAEPELEIVAAHLDHGLDPDSGDRARAAARSAAELGVRCVVERREVDVAVPGGRGLEAQARTERYGFLEEIRRREAARWIATAHHRDDQAETVLLRLLFGSNLAGLRGIRGAEGCLLRPLLDVSRRQIVSYLEARGIAWQEDATNRDLARPRNHVRHRLLPDLARDSTDLPRRLSRLASSVDSLAGGVERRLEALLDLRRDAGGATLDLAAFLALPESLHSWALAALHRVAGATYPPPESAQRELLRQLAARQRVGCDGGSGWRWKVAGNRLSVSPGRAETPDFSYTLSVPGRMTLEELGLEIGFESRAAAPWMLRPSANRAALALPVAPGDRVTVRNRRPGDRIQPLGWDRHCRVKNLLINRRVPEEQRSRLPLICHNDAIAWIPGVTIDERYRVSDPRPIWLATLRSSETPR